MSKNYTISAINVSYTRLGESDKLLTVFSREHGLMKLVAKGAFKPGSKIGGRCELLVVNRLLVAKGKSIDIISQAEIINANVKLRNDLNILAAALYHLELTKNFGNQLTDESSYYYDLLVSNLNVLIDGNPLWYTLRFQMVLAKMLGWEPQLKNCVICVSAINDHNLALFHYDLGGLVCTNCHRTKGAILSERINSYEVKSKNINPNLVTGSYSHLTPMVLKKIYEINLSSNDVLVKSSTIHESQLVRIYQLYKAYLEYKIGKKLTGFEVVMG